MVVVAAIARDIQVRRVDIEDIEEGGLLVMGGTGGMAGGTEVCVCMGGVMVRSGGSIAH